MTETQRGRERERACASSLHHAHNVSLCPSNKCPEQFTLWVHMCGMEGRWPARFIPASPMRPAAVRSSPNIQMRFHKYAWCACVSAMRRHRTVFISTGKLNLYIYIHTVIWIQVPPPPCASFPRVLSSPSPRRQPKDFPPKLLIKYHEMTHLPCRDVIPPMPCFSGNKTAAHWVTLFRGLHSQSNAYSKYPSSLLPAYVFREWPSCEAKTDLIILTPPSCHWIFPMLTVLLVALLELLFLLVLVFFQREAVLPVLLRLMLLPWLLAQHEHRGSARRDPGRILGSDDGRWRRELLGNQGHTHHTWRGAEDLYSALLRCHLWQLIKNGLFHIFPLPVHVRARVCVCV